MARGSKPGERRGGRKKGVPNRASQRRQAEVAASGATPLDVLLRRMRYHDAQAEAALKKKDATSAERHMREADDAARAAAPYVHPKLQSIQHTGREGGPIEVADMSRNDLARRILHMLRPDKP